MRNLFRTALLLLLGAAARAEDSGLPGGPFAASRYETLWTSSPFSVATPVAVESAEYALVGAAEFDGVSYASVIDKKSQEHFVVTNKTPSHGLTLVSLAHGTGPTSATLQRNGALLKLTADNTPPPPGAASPMSMPGMSGMPGMARPGMAPVNPYSIHRPSVRAYRTPVYVPTPPAPSP